jgi:hypothetical protein
MQTQTGQACNSSPAYQSCTTQCSAAHAATSRGTTLINRELLTAKTLVCSKTTSCITGNSTNSNSSSGAGAIVTLIAVLNVIVMALVAVVL